MLRMGIRKATRREEPGMNPLGPNTEADQDREQIFGVGWQKERQGLSFQAGRKRAKPEPRGSSEGFTRQEESRGRLDWTIL